MIQFKAIASATEFDQIIQVLPHELFQSAKAAAMKSDWQKHYYVGYLDGQVCIAFVLRVKPFLRFFKLAYIQHGFMVHDHNPKILKAGIAFLKQVSKTLKLSFVIIDPLIINRINQEPVAINPLLSIYESELMTLTRQPLIQPKHSFILNLMHDEHKAKSLSEVVKQFQKSVQSAIRGAENKGLVHERFNYEQMREHHDAWDAFYEVMNDTMVRLQAGSRSHAYYQGVLEAFKDEVMVDFVYYDYLKDKAHALSIKQTLDNPDTPNKLKPNLQSQYDAFTKREQQLRAHDYQLDQVNRITLAASFTLYYDTQAICLYGATKAILARETRASQFLNYKRIEYSVSQGMATHDFLRAFIQYRDERDANHGLVLFKKSFNADEIEYVGEFYLVNQKLIFSLFTRYYERINALIIRIKHRNKKNKS